LGQVWITETLTTVNIGCCTHGVNEVFYAQRMEYAGKRERCEMAGKKDLERLIREMRRQLLPYHHDHDAESGGRRWEVDREEYIASWLAQQLRTCREKNRCFRRSRCVFYEYGDLAKRNYDICYEVLLLLESGSIEVGIENDQED